jgi:hypothetical protein
MIKTSKVAAMMLHTKPQVWEEPSCPEVFYNKEHEILIGLGDIKEFAKKFNLTYTLDYINATVLFLDKQMPNVVVQ